MNWHAHPGGGHPEFYRRGLHVMPDHDEPRHWNRPDCWCQPTFVVRPPLDRWEHHASDGTEAPR